MSDTTVPIRPLADYIVCQAEEAQSKTASGLYLPGGSQEKPKVAKVVAVAANVSSVKVGDKVIYKEYSNSNVKVGSVEYILVEEKDVMATVA